MEKLFTQIHTVFIKTGQTTLAKNKQTAFL